MRILAGWADTARRQLSPNISAGHQSRECIVIHYTASYTAASAIATFKSKSGKSSAHFVVETGRPSVSTLVNMVVMQLELAGVVVRPVPGAALS